MIRLLHAGLGLSSELAELVDAVNKDTIDWVNVMEESADLAWYISVAVNALGFDHDEISSFEAEASNHPSVSKHSLVALHSAIEAAVWGTGNYNDLLKKHLFYGRELNMDKMKQTLQQLCMTIAGLCYVSGFTIEEGRERNINKLKARYGEKFSEAAALNRDLETERKILEGK
jgi:hypothetical protein